MPVLKFAELVTNSIGDPKTRFQNTKRDVLPALPHKSIPRKIPSVTRNIEEFEEASHVERTHESTTKQSTTKQRATKYIAQAKFIPTQDKVIYTPKQVIKDGFEYRVPTPITSKYLLFPPPESTSIIYHCRQGDLFRKREAIVETVVETVVEPAQDPVEERQPDRMDSQDDLSYYSNPIQVPGSWLSRWFTPIPSHWIRDNEVSHCYGCNQKFNFWLRIHHCRKCGNAFCHACSKHKAVLSDSVQRVCKPCFEKSIC